MPQLALYLGYVVVAFLGLVGAIVVYRMAVGAIDLENLISEANGRASFSRFQFLIFTFVIAGAVLVLTLEGGKFPELGADVLALLGLSSGSYVVSKGIQTSGGGPKKGDEPSGAASGQGAGGGAGAGPVAGAPSDRERP